jgi:hypothetical protein
VALHEPRPDERSPRTGTSSVANRTEGPEPLPHLRRGTRVPPGRLRRPRRRRHRPPRPRTPTTAASSSTLRGRPIGTARLAVLLGLTPQRRSRALLDPTSSAWPSSPRSREASPPSHRLQLESARLGSARAALTGGGTRVPYGCTRRPVSRAATTLLRGKPGACTRTDSREACSSSALRRPSC